MKLTLSCVALILGAAQGQLRISNKQRNSEKSSQGVRLSCTASGGDPYSSGSLVECCAGLNQELINDGGYRYICIGPDCTGSGEDPYSSGSHVNCCAGLNEELINDGGRYHYVCQSSGPAPGPGPAPDGSSLSVVTQNLFWWRLFDELGGLNFFNVFRSYGPYDIFFFQECKDVAFIRNGLGYGGMQIIQAEHEVAMMYSDRFILRDSGFDVVGEDSPAQYYGERGLVWARLEDTASGKTFLVASHHGPLPTNSGGKFGGEDVANRITTAINSHRVSGDYVIVGGDFNADQNSETVFQMKAHGFDLIANDWMDNIFTLGPSPGSLADTTIIRDTGSDHRGIKVTWQIGGDDVGDVAEVIA